jgi:hypothetical protein
MPPVLKTIAEVNSTDNIMPKAAPVHGSSNDFTIPTVEASTSEARKEADQKNAVKTKNDTPKAGSVEKKEQADDKNVGENNAASVTKKKDSHAHNFSQTSSDTKEAHRNMRFWKKRAEVNKTGLLRPEGASEELVEDSKETHLVLKTIAEVNPTDDIMLKAAPVHGLSNENTTPTVEASLFKCETVEAFLGKILPQCGCLAEFTLNQKDGDGATSKSVAFGKLKLDDEMDIDQAVAAMIRSRRKERMPIKAIEFPEDYIRTATSSVTDSQAAVFEPKSMPESGTKSNDSGTINSGLAKSFLPKWGKSSRRRT